MKTIDAAIQIKSLRAQIDVLEAKLRANPTSETSHSLADLRGTVHPTTPTTDDEIDAARYRGAKPDAA